MAQARDASRPQIDLRARVGLSGIGASYADNTEVLGDLEGRSWNGGLELRMPLGDDPERLRLALVNQVREQYRRVRINARRAGVADLAEARARRLQAVVESGKALIEWRRLTRAPD